MRRVVVLLVWSKNSNGWSAFAERAASDKDRIDFCLDVFKSDLFFQLAFVR